MWWWMFSKCFLCNSFFFEVWILWGWKIAHPDWTLAGDCGSFNGLAIVLNPLFHWAKKKCRYTRESKMEMESPAFWGVFCVISVPIRKEIFPVKLVPSPECICNTLLHMLRSNPQDGDRPGTRDLLYRGVSADGCGRSLPTKHFAAAGIARISWDRIGDVRMFVASLRKGISAET